MKHKDIFETNYLKEFISLADDPVKNVRIQMAKTLHTHHKDNGSFILNKEI